MHATSPTAAAFVAAASPFDVARTESTDFDSFYWPLFVRSFRLAYRIVGDRAEAEDVAADALARAHLHWRRIGSLPYRDAWVLRVAGNLARSVVRRRRPHIDAPTPPEWEDDVVKGLALRAAVSSLPRRQRESITLRYLAGLDHEEIASCLRVSPASVRTHIRRGLRSLRESLGIKENGSDHDDD